MTPRYQRNRSAVLTRLLAKYNNICYLCEGKFGEGAKPSIDHKYSLVWGGADTEDNWAPVHSQCNFRKEGKGALKIQEIFDRYLIQKNHRQISEEDFYQKLNTYLAEDAALVGLTIKYLLKKRVGNHGPEIGRRIQEVVDKIIVSGVSEEELFRYYNIQSKHIAKWQKIDADPDVKLRSVILQARGWVHCNPELKKQVDEYAFNNVEEIFAICRKELAVGKKKRDVKSDMQISYIIDLMKRITLALNLPN